HSPQPCAISTAVDPYVARKLRLCRFFASRLQPRPAVEPMVSRTRAGGEAIGAVSDDQLTISIVNDVAELPRAAEAVEGFCEERAIAAPCVFALNVALEELLSNTIFYGFDDAATHSITIALRHDGDAVTVELSDDARPFDPREAPPPDLDASLEDRPIGG